MDVYKLKQGAGVIKKITKENFEEDTGLRAPYYSADRRSPAAVCPVCDNPILIIGLYERERPYGKHHNKTIEGLATYNSYSYRGCLYANPFHRDTERKRSQEKTAKAELILSTVVNHFDSIVALLTEETDIRFSMNLIRKMLTTYRVNNGCCYLYAHQANAPWAFVYLTWRNSIFGVQIEENSELRTALNKEKRIAFDNGRIVSADGKFLAVDYYFAGHCIKTRDGITNEYIDFIVVLDENGKDRVIFSKTIKIDITKFSALINSERKQTERDRALLNLARELLNEG